VKFVLEVRRGTKTRMMTFRVRILDVVDEEAFKAVDDDVRDVRKDSLHGLHAFLDGEEGVLGGIIGIATITVSKISSDRSTMSMWRR